MPPFEARRRHCEARSNLCIKLQRAKRNTAITRTNELTQITTT